MAECEWKVHMANNDDGLPENKPLGQDFTTLSESFEENSRSYNGVYTKHHIEVGFIIFDPKFQSDQNNFKISPAALSFVTHIPKGEKSPEAHRPWVPKIGYILVIMMS